VGAPRKSRLRSRPRRLVHHLSLGEFVRLDIPLKQEMLEILPGLLKDFDLHVIEDRYLPESFGNSDVTLQSPQLLVRFVRDRGQVWAEVAPVTEPTSWWPLGDVLKAIQGQLPEAPFDLTSAVRLLRDNFRELADALGPRLTGTHRDIERLREARLKEMTERGREAARRIREASGNS
jgi:hypothetical protein